MFSWKTKTPGGCHSGKRYRVTLTESERESICGNWSAWVRRPHAQKPCSSKNPAAGGSGGRRFVEVRPGDCRIVGLRSSQRRTRYANGLLRKASEAALEPCRANGCTNARWDGVAEAHLIALACGALPEGRSRAGRFVCWVTRWWCWSIWNRCPSRRRPGAKKRAASS